MLLRGLELLATVLLARNRQPSLTVAASVPQAGFASELVSLPSGLLAMVCEAIVTLKVLLRVACVRACVRVCVRACVHLCCVGRQRGPTRSRRVHIACKSRAGAVLASRGGPTVWKVL